MASEMNLQVTFIKLLIVVSLLLTAGHTQCSETTQPITLRVMTYNIHHGRGTDNLINLPRIAEVLKNAAPDIVALQEVDIKTKRSGGVDQLAELARLTNMHGKFAKGRDYDGGDYGQAILSRWPIEFMQVQTLPGPTVEDERIAVVARVQPSPSAPPVLLVATHLHHQGEPLRLAQAQKLQEIVAQHPTSSTAILLGDLNAEPKSNVMNFFLTHWIDTLPEHVLTYPSIGPKKKIDWVLLPHRSPWRVSNSHVIAETEASDHRPVVADLLQVEPPPTQ